MALQLQKQTSVIPRNEKEGRPIFTKGGRVRFLGLPVDSAGNVVLNTPQLSFQGSFDGSLWFTINDSAGRPVEVTTRAVQKVIHRDSGLAAAPANLPIGDSGLFEGIQMLRPVGNVAEKEERSIEFYFE